MKNILAAIMLMGATVSVDAMAPNAMQLNTTTLGIIDTARQQFIAATRQARKSLFAWNKAAFNPCRQTRNAMLAHLDTLLDLFNQYAGGRFVKFSDMIAIFGQQINDVSTCHTALAMWDSITQSSSEESFSRILSGKTKTQHKTTIDDIINAIHSACADTLADIRIHIYANPIYRELQNLPKANISGSEGQCSNILDIQAAINEGRAEINQLENNLLTQLRQHVAGATLQDLELALDQNHQNLTITQQAIRNLPRQIRDPLTRQFNDFRRRRRTVLGRINRQKGTARNCIADLHRIPTQNDALRDQVCARLTHLVNAL